MKTSKTAADSVGGADTAQLHPQTPHKAAHREARTAQAPDKEQAGPFHSHTTSHSHSSHSHSTAHSHGESHSHSHSHGAHDHNHHSHNHNHSHSHSHSHESNTHNLQRNLTEIERLIRQAELPPRAEAWSLAVFRNLAIAEATVHGTTIEAVHFHEVGAVDAIVDIVGTCLGLDYLDIDEIHYSPLPTGGGTVWAAHGRLPVPAPAVLQLFSMGQVPVYGNGIERELVTPTGAAIAMTLAQRFGPPPPMALQTIGLGAGTIDLPIPNLVRLWVGESAAQPETQSTTRQTTQKTIQKTAQLAKSDRESRAGKTSPGDNTPETVTLLQTQLDDVSPQAIGYAFERLLEAGALDVFTQAIAMKKNRPGILLSVICADAKVADCEAILFRETSTLGIRRQTQQRSILQRHWQTVTTVYGPVRIKLAKADGGETQSPLNVQPEYEDCAAIARTHNLPWRDVHQLALQAWHEAQQA